MKRGRIKPVNSRRRKETFAKGFGSKRRGELIRAMGCLVALEFVSRGLTIPEAVALGWQGCSGDIQFTHVIARQHGAVHGDKSKGVPLCDCHATEAGEGSMHRSPSIRARFERVYTLDLFAAAARIALDLDEQGIP